MKAAAFLDRDGTIIELVHHLNSPNQVRMIDGAGLAIARFNDLGIPVIIVTNQSVIGRGKLTEDGLVDIHVVMSEMLAKDGAHVDAIYHCPVAPTIKDSRVVDHPDRKPGRGMLMRAAADLSLDITRSVMVGDTLSDMLAGRNAKVGATVLVKTGYGPKMILPDPAVDHVVADMAEATHIIESRCLIGTNS